MDDILNNCNDEQVEFIKSKLENCCLLGIPGGGKTTTIIKKILYHKYLGEIDKNEFLIISFSRKACHDFIEKGTQYNKKLFSKNNVKTLHSLAGTIINSVDNSNSMSIDIVICKALYHIKQTNTNEIKNIKGLTKLKLMIIDEAQDISLIQYELATSICSKLKIPLILVGDPNQNIYQFQNGSDKYLMEHSNRKYYLKKNYRSTPEIVDLVNGIKPWKNIIPDMISTRQSGSKPVIVSNTMNNILNDFVERLKNYVHDGVNLKDIAIIGPVKKSNQDQYGMYKNIGLQFFVNYFEKNNIKYVKHYNESSLNSDVIPTNTCAIDDHVNLFTIHGSKGLEFKTVFVLNFHTTTYGRNPSEKDYTYFRYLWYVGLSRARDDLIVYVNDTKNIWWELANVPTNKYIVKGNISMNKPFFSDEANRPNSITELLKTKNIFDEKILLDINNILNISFKSYKMSNDVSIIEQSSNEYSSLIGSYVEQLFEYEYSIFHNIEYRYATNIKLFLQNRICISNKFAHTLGNFMRKTMNVINQPININQLNNYKNTFNNDERMLYEEICEKMSIMDKMNNVGLYIETNDKYDNPTEILQIIENINKDYRRSIFYLVLYLYQLEHETGYLWKKKDDMFNDINVPFEIIKEVAQYTNSCLEFQKPTKHKYISDFYGCIDCYDDKNKTIYEIKNIKSVGLIQYLQTIFYNLSLAPNIKNKNRILIYNFYDCMIHEIYFEPKINSFQIILKLSEILKTPIDSLVIVYDLETTGLIQEDIYPEIIDRHFYEINLESVIDTGLVKPNNKISPFITQLTGITNNMLDETGQLSFEFMHKFRKLNVKFNKPIYIAHNGNAFDHKIMCHYNLLNNYDCVFHDSRVILVNYLKLNGINSTGKLTDLYKIIIGHEPLTSHRAECDTMMIVEIFDKLKILDMMYLNS